MCTIAVCVDSCVLFYVVRGGLKMDTSVNERADITQDSGIIRPMLSRCVKWLHEEIEMRERSNATYVIVGIYDRRFNAELVEYRRERK